MTLDEARDEVKNLLDYIRGEKELKPIKTKEDAETEERKGIEALEMAIKALEQTRWIPVSERLPDKNGEYLVTLKQGFATFGIWVGVAENWENVIAWLPLPEQYKAEKE